MIASPQDWDFWGRSHHHLLSTSWGVGGGLDLCLCDTTIALPRAFGQGPRRLQGQGVSRGLGTRLEDSHPDLGVSFVICREPR